MFAILLVHYNKINWAFGKS